MPAIRRSFHRAIALLPALACAIAGAATPLPLPPGTDMCGALQAYLRAGRIAELEANEIHGLNIAGHRADVAIRSRGTGLAPYAVITDAATHEAFDDGLGEVAGDPRGLGAIATFGGRHHVVLMAREEAGGETVALDGGPSCTIERSRVESVAPASTEPAFCRKVLGGGVPNEARFTRPVTLSEAALAARWNGASSNIGLVTAGLAAHVDIANDGHPVDIVQLTASIRQPDICTVHLWDVVGAPGTRLANDQERHALGLRGIVPSDPADGGDCALETHFLLDGKRVLVQTLERSQVENGQPYVDRITSVRHGEIRSVCEFTFKDEWAVTPVAPNSPASQ